MIPAIAMADPARECKPAGSVLFEIDQLADADAKLPTATTKLYDNGAWRTDWIDANGKVTRSGGGCLEPKQIDAIRADLRAAKWRVTHNRITCRAHSPRYTTYAWNGRREFTERVCSPDALDDGSWALVKRIREAVHAPTDLDDAAKQMRCLENPLAAGC